jgi:YggT family protein
MRRAEGIVPSAACVRHRRTLGSALRVLQYTGRRTAMSPIIPIIELISAIIEIFIWMLIVSAILSWLTAFGVINRYNRVVATIGDTLYRLTDPVLRPIRNILPNLGGVDVSPIVAILLLTFINREIGILAFAYLN